MVTAKTARQLTLDALFRIEAKGEFAKRALDEALNNPRSSSDKALIMEIVYGVLRHRNRFDWIIEDQAERDIETIDPYVRNNLRMGLYQTLFLNRIPEWAVVDESVELAKIYGHRGIAGFVNGVLRNIIRNKEGIRYPSLNENPILHISVLYSRGSSMPVQALEARLHI
jgi:16S rRNA (cytosine967-C5)-methyltransferase